MFPTAGAVSGADCKPAGIIRDRIGNAVTPGVPHFKRLTGGILANMGDGRKVGPTLNPAGGIEDTQS